METPILRLESDAWSSITALLFFDEVRNLLLTGNRKLTQLVGNTARSFMIERRLHSIDLDCILHTAKSTPNLREIHIQAWIGGYKLIAPLRHLDFPSKLTKLIGVFTNALNFFLVAHDISQLAPTLTHLHLRGVFESRLELGNLRFPPNLQTLALESSVIVIQKEEEIANLPRTLTNLELKTRGLPDISRNVWPPELSLLHLHNLHADTTIEHLPRTLCDLMLYAMRGKMRTSFKSERSGGHFAFPWRQFFPLLTHFENHYPFDGPLHATIKSIVVSDAYEASTVNEFVSSGFWSLQQPTWVLSAPYPLFKTIDIAEEMAELATTARDLAPWLREIVDIGGVSREAIRYLPSVRSLRALDEPFNFDVTDENAFLPTQIEKLTCPSISLSAIERLPRLERLSVTSFGASEGDDVGLHSVKWSSNLKLLATTSKLQAPALLNLPSSLTDLGVAITTHAAWTVIATHLIHLRTLSLELNLKWWNVDEPIDQPLTPMKSDTLEKLVLRFQSAPSEKIARPFADEFFGKHSPLPASIKRLVLNSISTDSPVPVTVFPSLPRNLVELTLVSFIDWENPHFFVEPHVASMTPSELLASLPRGIESLNMQKYGTEAESSRRSYESLAFLPQTLCHFGTTGLFTMPSQPAAVAEIVKHLPSKLTSLHYDGVTFGVSKEYFKQRRPYLVEEIKPSP